MFSAMVAHYRRPALVALILTCASAVLLIPVGWFIPGGAAWAVALMIAVRQHDPRVRRNLGAVLACIALLAFAPVNTNLETSHILTLGSCFLLAILGPYVFMRLKTPEWIAWRLWPPRFSRRDLIYTLVSIPLAWGVIQVYFFHLNPELPTHWPIPAIYDADAVHRLVVGINCVGIWDELFFINTVYVLFRGIFPARIANPAQAVLYTSVLHKMAFTGHGTWIVYLFALTQGVMYEKSRVLLYVLIVHLIVDVFLLLAILQYHYPTHSLRVF